MRALWYFFLMRYVIVLYFDVCMLPTARGNGKEIIQIISRTCKCYIMKIMIVLFLLLLFLCIFCKM